MKCRKLLKEEKKPQKGRKKGTERGCRNFLTNIPESLNLKRKNKKEGITFFFYFLICSRTSLRFSIFFYLFQFFYFFKKLVKNSIMLPLRFPMLLRNFSFLLPAFYDAFSYTFWIFFHFLNVFLLHHYDISRNFLLEIFLHSCHASAIVRKQYTAASKKEARDFFSSNIPSISSCISFVYSIFHFLSLLNNFNTGNFIFQYFY